MKTYNIQKLSSGNFRSEVTCEGCGKILVITKSTERLLKQALCKQKYCEECAKKSIQISNRISRMERNKNRTQEEQFGISEFNEGYKRFWVKRGYKPPAVNQYVLEKL